MTSRRQPAFPAFDPASYLELAKQLAQQDAPAAKRTAADRAYYAAFLTSRDTLAAQNLLTPYYNELDPQYVVENLRRLLGSKGNDEQRLRRARNRITYDTKEVTEGPSLQWIIETADEIIQEIKKIG